MQPSGVTASVTSSSRMVQSPISFIAALTGSAPSVPDIACPASQATGSSTSSSVTLRSGHKRPVRSRQGQETGFARRLGAGGGKAMRKMACSISYNSPARRVW